MTISLEHITENDWAAVNRNTDMLRDAVNPPVVAARVFNSAAITLTSGVGAVLTFDSERFDTGNLHSTVSNTSRLTAPITGLYLIGASVEFAANATGIRQFTLRLNGTTIIGVIDQVLSSAGGVTWLTTDTIYRLVAGDYVEVVAAQNSGGNLNVNASGNYSPEFWMFRLSGYTNVGF